MKNRFNRLTSKEWLPFQKSWFKYTDEATLLRENILFFCPAEKTKDVVFYSGSNTATVEKICQDHDISYAETNEGEDVAIQFGFLDVRHKIRNIDHISQYYDLRDEIVSQADSLYEKILHRKFLCIVIPNLFIKNEYYPIAWDIAQHIASIYSLKDEKIGCLPITEEKPLTDIFIPHGEIFYCLYFRKDENSKGKYSPYSNDLFENNLQLESQNKFTDSIPSWFILKPTPRKKSEILHPAKYPEELVKMFLETFTSPGDNIIDPMSGTGSTQVAALRCGRNAYGTELSSFFYEIAQKRCSEEIHPAQISLFDQNPTNVSFTILHKDARLITKNDFPNISYLITSPPYWDMLNMKGAENQAKRIEKGLRTNYSDVSEDLGNVEDYYAFIDELADIYFNIIDLMDHRAYITIVVKNIKKKGKNYPFAWDLAAKLMKKVILLPEVFWCQDDINLAPYGYGNTFVSNTFHQYCLNFMKP